MIGMVTSHSCDYTKYTEAGSDLGAIEAQSWPLSVAPMYTLSHLKPSFQGLAMEGSGGTSRCLPQAAKDIVDLGFEQPLPIVVLSRLEVFGRLSGEYVDRLSMQMIRFKTRVDVLAMQQEIDHLRSAAINHIELDAFLLCDSASALGGKLFVLGGGVTRLLLPSFPTGLPMMTVVAGSGSTKARPSDSILSSSGSCVPMERATHWNSRERWGASGRTSSMARSYTRTSYSRSVRSSSR